MNGINFDGNDVINNSTFGNSEIAFYWLTEIENYDDLINNHLQETSTGDALIVYGSNSILLTSVGIDDIGVGKALDADNFLF